MDKSKIKLGKHPYNPEKVSQRSRWVREGGWRGYFEPLWWIAGANDTGKLFDSPCRTDVCLRELRELRRKIKKEFDVPMRILVFDSSNVFCKHRYLVCAEVHWERCMELAKKHYNPKKTTLLYINEKERDDKTDL